MSVVPGVYVRPRPEYVDLGQVPTGKVLSVVRFGKHGAVYVEGERRAFGAECFEVVSESVRAA
jgi:hypothetical protein